MTAVAPALLAASALAVAPVGGATYRGSLAGSRASITIRFSVSRDGSRVQGIRIASLPIYCPGSVPPGAPNVVFASARISRAGTFAAVGHDVVASGRLKGSVAATLHVRGTFGTGGTVHGTLATSYGPTAKGCDGRSAFSARAG